MFKTYTFHAHTHESKIHHYTSSYFNINTLFSNTINVATLNIRGAFESKLITLIDYMITSDIHFLHLCESHKKDQNNSLKNYIDFQQNNKNNHKCLKHTHFTHTPTNQKFIIIHNPDPDNLSSGVTIIISPILYKYIGPIYFIPERMIHVTFFFKQYHQLNIINVYLPPIMSAHNYFQVMNMIDIYISKNLNNANKYNYYIMMRDININPHNKKLTYKNYNNIDT
ncbi:hypothetical protein RhiirB3_448538 [Rhizophagus irregularis]|nr:hypothetical protein RhiirB3_448538 [Rhizophagus irregularis]